MDCLTPLSVLYFYCILALMYNYLARDETIYILKKKTLDNFLSGPQFSPPQLFPTHADTRHSTLRPTPILVRPLCV